MDPYGASNIDFTSAGDINTVMKPLSDMGASGEEIALPITTQHMGVPALVILCPAFTPDIVTVTFNKYFTNLQIHSSFEASL